MLVWRLSDGVLLQALPTHTGTSVNVARLNGAELLTAASDRTLRLWDLAGPRSRVFGGSAGSGHTGAVRCAERVGPDRSFEFPLPDTLVSWSQALPLVRGPGRAGGRRGGGVGRARSAHVGYGTWFQSGERCL